MQIPASTRRKTEQQRRDAVRELPKTRLCGKVVLAVLSGPDEVAQALAELRSGLGGGWHLVTAFQFMSGQQAFFSALCEDEAASSDLLLAHRIAKAAAEAQAITRVDLEMLRAVCAEAKARVASASAEVGEHHG